MSSYEPELSKEPEVYYPTSDGAPMAENDQTRELMFDAIKTLERYYEADPQVYVSGNLLVYYQEGDPRRCVAPDVLVVKGVPKRRRDYYQTWVEGKGLDLVIEISSPATFRRDLGFKAQLYFNRLEVKEYILFDYSGSLLPQGPLFALVREGDEVVERSPDERGRIRSEVLGLELAAEGGQLRFYDPQTGQRLPAPGEQLQAVEQRLREEEERRRALEERLRALEEELARRKG